MSFVFIRILFLFIIQFLFYFYGFSANPGSGNNGFKNGPAVDGTIQSDQKLTQNPKAIEQLKSKLKQSRSSQNKPFWRELTEERPHHSLIPKITPSQIRQIKNIEVISFVLGQTTIDLSVNKITGEIKSIQKNNQVQGSGLEMKAIPMDQPFMTTSSLLSEYKTEQLVNIILLQEQKKVFISFGKQFAVLDLLTHHTVFSGKLTKKIEYSLISRNKQNLVLFTSDQVFHFDIAHPFLISPQPILSLDEPMQSAPLVIENEIHERFIKIQEQSGMSYYLEEATLEIRLVAHEVNWSEPLQEVRVSDPENSGQYIQLSGKGSRFLKISKIVPKDELTLWSIVINKWHSGNSSVESTFKEFSSTLLGHPFMIKNKKGEKKIISRTQDQLHILDEEGRMVEEFLPIHKIELMNQEDSVKFKTIFQPDGKQIGYTDLSKTQKITWSLMSDGSSVSVLEMPAGGIYIINKNAEVNLSSIHRYNGLTKQEEDLGLTKDDLMLMLSPFQMDGVLFLGVILSQGYLKDSLLIYDFISDQIYTVDN